MFLHIHMSATHMHTVLAAHHTMYNAQYSVHCTQGRIKAQAN